MISKNRNGMVLGMVIILMAILSILGVSLLSLSVASAKSTAYQDKSKQAYYLAKSGADAVSTHLINYPSDDKLLLTKTSNENSHFGNGSFKVSVNGGSNELKISGTGNVSGVEKTTTIIIGKMTVGEMIDKAVYTHSKLDITGMSVEGDVQSGGNVNYKTNGSHAFKGKALANASKIIETVLPPIDPPLYYPQDLTVSGTITISDSCRLNKITIDNNKTLKIVANNKVVNIVVNTLEGKGNINIEATGVGRVNLFVITNMEVTTKGNINNDDPNKLYIYMQKGSTFKLQANIKVFAYIIAPEADAVVQSNQSTIYGAIIANKLTKNESNGPNGAVVYVLPTNSLEYDDNLKAYKIIKWEE